MKTLSLYSKLLSLSSPAAIKSELKSFKYQQSNGVIFGGSCSGRAVHPWEGLKNCPIRFKSIKNNQEVEVK